REFADLRPHVPLRHGLVVDVERGFAERLAVLAGLLAHELHAQRVLSRRELARDELLLWLDPEEVVDVIQLLVLDEQRVAAKPRSVREDDARAVAFRDLDVGDDLVRPAPYVHGDALRDR